VTRVLAVAAFGAFLFVANAFMDLLGLLFTLGLLATALLAFGFVFAVRSTGTRPARPRLKRTSQNMADNAPEEVDA
jgi:uncharacterized membrane protein YciS (DUF1049 family)